MLFCRDASISNAGRKREMKKQNKHCNRGSLNAINTIILNLIPITHASRLRFALCGARRKPKGEHYESYYSGQLR